MGPICADNTATRPPQDPRDSAVTWATYPTDGPRYRVRLPIKYADRIEAPTYLAYGRQDDQTGPRGNPALFHAVRPEPASPPGTPPGLDPLHEEPKLLRVVNGYHATVASDPRGWFDYWLRGEDTGIMDAPPVRVRTGVNTTDAEVAWEMASFLQPDVDWTRLYLQENGALSRSTPDAAGADQYVTGSPRQSWVYSGDDTGNEVLLADGPDVLTYRSPPFETPTRIVGPISATLHAATSVPGTNVPLRGTSTDFFVRVADEFPDGRVVPLQRGVLRATHRQLDEARTLYNDAGEVVRPYHPHTARETILPGEVYHYDIEVWPLAHLLREDHRLVVRIHSPPATDGIWSYEPLDTFGINTIHRSPEHPSSVLFPLQEWPQNESLPPTQACGQPDGYRCIDGYDTGVGVDSGVESDPT